MLVIVHYIQMVFIVLPDFLIVFKFKIGAVVEVGLSEYCASMLTTGPQRSRV
jgi:hypothetical protein